MNNPIQVAIAKIFSEIPSEILNLTFRRIHPTLPLDQIIINEVIRRKVYNDCNIVGGKVKEIPLLLSYHESTVYGLPETTLHEGRYSLYRIPPAARDNLPISSISHMTYPSLIASNGMNGLYCYQGNTVADFADQVLESHTLSRSYTTPIGELLSGDLIRLNPSQHNHIDWIVSVKLEYDLNFSNLNQSAILSFGKLCLLAVKAYIYNNLIIQIDKAYIIGGVELTTIKDIVAGYIESSREYDELLTEKFIGAVTLDPRRMQNILKHMM